MAFQSKKGYCMQLHCLKLTQFFVLTILFNLALDFSQTRIKMFYEKETLLSINFDEYQIGNLLRNFKSIFMWKTLKCLKDVPWILSHHCFSNVYGSSFYRRHIFKVFFFFKWKTQKSQKISKVRSSVQFSSVAQSCPTLWDPMNRSTPGLPVHHQLPEFTQTQVHRVPDAIQPSHPWLSPSPPAPNPS